MSAAWSTARAVVSRLVRPLLLVAIPALAVLIGLYVYARGGREVETENAYVKANVVVVSSEVSGRVAEVNVHDNEPVTAGAPLFRLDPTPFELAVAKASAQMEVVRTDVQSLQAEYRATLQEAVEAEDRIGFLTRQLERQERLKEQGMSRADVYDEARHNLHVAQSRLKSIHEVTNRELAGLLGDPK
jgi:membrane fusion protein (multidrug efflux system)